MPLLCIDLIQQSGICFSFPFLWSGEENFTLGSYFGSLNMDDDDNEHTNRSTNDEHLYNNFKRIKYELFTNRHCWRLFLRFCINRLRWFPLYRLALSSLLENGFVIHFSHCNSQLKRYNEIY